MRLIVDTSVLVGELLRAVGRKRLGDDRLDLFVPERMRHELDVELPRRVGAFARRHRLDVAADIWTNDNDFLGTGIATWTTDLLRAWLQRQPSTAT